MNGSRPEALGSAPRARRSLTRLVISSIVLGAGSGLTVADLIGDRALRVVVGIVVGVWVIAIFFWVERRADELTACVGFMMAGLIMIGLGIWWMTHPVDGEVWTHRGYGGIITGGVAFVAGAGIGAGEAIRAFRKRRSGTGQRAG